MQGKYFGITTEGQIKQYNPNYNEPYEEIANVYTPYSWLNGRVKTTIPAGNITLYGFTLGNGEGMLERKNTRAYNMIFDGVEMNENTGYGKAYWLASKSIDVHDNYDNTLKVAEFYLDGVFSIENTYIIGAGSGASMAESKFNSAWTSTGSGSEVGTGYWAVRPVVILKPGITTDAVQKIPDKQEETWNYIPAF